MKSVRWLLIVVILGSMALTARGDGIDPQPKLVGGGGSQDVTTSMFSFTVNANGTNTIDNFFDNVTGQTGVELDILITLSQAAQDLTFTLPEEGSNNYFQNESITQLASGQWLIQWFGLNPELGLNGIPNDNGECIECFGNTDPHFDIQFFGNDIDGTNFASGTKLFDVDANLIATPEPPTALILLAGASLLLLLKRFW